MRLWQKSQYQKIRNLSRCNKSFFKLSFHSHIFQKSEEKKLPKQIEQKEFNNNPAEFLKNDTPNNNSKSKKKNNSNKMQSEESVSPRIENNEKLNLLNIEVKKNIIFFLNLNKH